VNDEPRSVKPLPSRERLLELLDYNAVTGEFRWKAKRRGVKVGSLAGKDDGFGYIVITVEYVEYRAHRLAYAFMGQPVPAQVDHINRVRSDNRWANLRASTQAFNHKNKGLPKNNKSGCPGVKWDANARKWRAEITVAGRRINLGIFTDVGDAVAARTLANLEHGFNTGEATHA
jgi:hypothetical protein